jgi:hypothetical protein
MEKFDICSKIDVKDVGNFFRQSDKLFLRHQIRMSENSINSFYSVVLKLYMLWYLFRCMVKKEVIFFVLLLFILFLL